MPTTLFLSYARKDGNTAAAQLRQDLQRSGFQIWRDIEDMRSGQDWKNQLRQAIKAVDAVLVLLTPASVASQYVTWEWETAQTLDKRVIPILVQDCNVPQDLNRLHYHRLDTPENYVSGLMGLVRDLIQLSTDAKEATQPKPPEAKGTQINQTITGNNNQTIGQVHGGTVIGNVDSNVTL
ncbi:MAG: toll/interleukin-1 receptor domain-containing protein [Elainellaceae cyanobacterium]